MMDSINQTTGLCGCLAKFFDDLALLNYENQQNVLKKNLSKIPITGCFQSNFA